MMKIVMKLILIRSYKDQTLREFSPELNLLGGQREIDENKHLPKFVGLGITPGISALLAAKGQEQLHSAKCLSLKD